MDSRIVKKMNEIIALLKVIERELAGRTSIDDKRKLASERKVSVDVKMKELEEMMAEIFSDDVTIRYHQQLKEEANRVLSVNVHPPYRYM